MKANEFVKKFGWLQAENVLSGEEGFKEVSIYLPNDDFDKPTILNVGELKRLVESWEFVSSNGGIDGAVEYCNRHDPSKTSKHYNSLRGKIADVESCQ